MSNKIDKKLLEKVSGGVEIVHESQNLTRQEELEKELKALQDMLNRDNNSYKESMELMKKIADVTREIQNLKNEPGTIVRNN